MAAPGIIKANCGDPEQWAWLSEYFADRDRREQLFTDAAAIWPGDGNGFDRLMFCLAHAPGGLTEDEGRRLLGNDHTDGIVLSTYPTIRRAPGFLDTFGAWHPHPQADGTWLLANAAAWGFQPARFIFRYATTHTY